jgi:hypothetical protein
MLKSAIIDCFTILGALSLLLLQSGCAAGPHPLPAERWNPGLDLAYNQWKPRISKSLKVGPKYGEGTRNNLVGDLGYDRNEEVHSFRAQAHLSPSWNLDVEYLNLEMSGKEGLKRPVRWNDQVFPKHYNLDSELDLSQLTVKIGKERLSLP